MVERLVFTQFPPLLLQERLASTTTLVTSAGVLKASEETGARRTYVQPMGVRMEELAVRNPTLSTAIAPLDLAAPIVRSTSTTAPRHRAKTAESVSIW